MRQACRAEGGANLPAMVYYGVDTDEAVLMRMNSVPRGAAGAMGRAYAAEHDIRDSRPSDVREWLGGLAVRGGARQRGARACPASSTSASGAGWRGWTRRRGRQWRRRRGVGRRARRDRDTVPGDVRMLFWRRGQLPRGPAASAFFISAEPACFRMCCKRTSGNSPCWFCLSDRIYAVYANPAGCPLMHCADCGGYWFPRHTDPPEHENRAKEHKRPEDRRPDYDFGRYRAQLDALEHYLGRSRVEGNSCMVYFGSSRTFLKGAGEKSTETAGGGEQEATGHNLDLGAETSLDKVPDGSCDIVYASHAIEHQPYPALTLQELACKLREGGMLVMASACCSAMLVGSNTLRLYDTAYPRWLSYFTLEAAVKMMERAGLSIEHSVSRFEDNGQALRCIGEGLELGADRLAGPLQEAPFYAGTGLVVVGKKVRHQEPSSTETRPVGVVRLSETRGVHYVLTDELRVPLPPGKSVITGNIIALGTPEDSTQVTVGFDWLAGERIRANSGPRSFAFENDGSSENLVIRGENAEVFLYDLFSTELLEESTRPPGSPMGDSGT